MISILANANSSFWMPERASTAAGDVDSLFHFIFWLSVFFFVLIAALLVIFIWRYRYREGQEHDTSGSHSTALELTWTIIPTILVVIIFYYGFRGYLRMSVSPPNAYEIQVNARMWNWTFTYPNGHVDSELHVPVDTPVRLVLSSEDVIHSLFIPAFRVKKDAVPGRYNKFWFEATLPGEYDVYCAEYCGTNHSQMLTKAVVHDPSEFRNWLEQAANWETRMTPMEAGRMFFSKRGCVQCHSVDGTRIIGPTLKDLFGASRQFKDGGTAAADEDYIRESLLAPQKRIVAGFDGSMPSYQGTLKDRDITAIIAYLKSISVHFQGDPNAAPTTQPQPQQP